MSYYQDRRDYPPQKIQNMSQKMDQFYHQNGPRRFPSRPPYQNYRQAPPQHHGGYEQGYVPRGPPMGRGGPPRPPYQGGGRYPPPQQQMRRPPPPQHMAGPPPAYMQRAPMPPQMTQEHPSSQVSQTSQSNIPKQSPRKQADSFVFSSERNFDINIQLVSKDYFTLQVLKCPSERIFQNLKQGMKEFAQNKNNKGIEINESGHPLSYKVSLKHYLELVGYLEDYLSDEFQDKTMLRCPPESAFDLLHYNTPFQNSYPRSEAFQSLKTFYEQEQEEPPLDLPEPFNTNLYPFQKSGVAFGLKRHCRFLLGDDMGVGKTIQALALCAVYRNDWPFAVICPSSLRFSWYEEILNWFPDVKEQDINLVESSRSSLLNGKKIHLISYEMATKFAHQFEKTGIQFVIADEAHYLKSSKSKRSQFLVPLLSRMKRLILMTGTPMLSRPVELFNILKMVRPEIFCNFREYANRYCNPSLGYNNCVQYSGADNTAEMNFLLKEKIMIRRQKKAILHELPQKIRQRVFIETDEALTREIQKLLRINLRNEKQRQELEKAIRKRESEFELDGRMNSTNLTKDFKGKGGGCVAYNQALKLSGEAKLKGVKDFIDKLLEGEQKFVVFAHHKDVMAEVGRHLGQKLQKGQNYVVINGETEVEKRNFLIKQFQEAENYRVAILSIQACGVGLNIQGVSTAIMAEILWNPATMTQAEDRLHRMGQQHKVHIYYMFGQNTLDEIVFPILNFKSSVISRAIDGIEGTQEPLQGEEEEELRESDIDELDELDEIEELQEKGAGQEGEEEEEEQSTGVEQAEGQRSFDEKLAQADLKEVMEDAVVEKKPRPEAFVIRKGQPKQKQHLKEDSDQEEPVPIQTKQKPGGFKFKKKVVQEQKEQNLDGLNNLLQQEQEVEESSDLPKIEQIYSKPVPKKPPPPPPVQKKKEENPFMQEDIEDKISLKDLNQESSEQQADQPMIEENEEEQFDYDNFQREEVEQQQQQDNNNNDYDAYAQYGEQEQLGGEGEGFVGGVGEQMEFGGMQQQERKFQPGGKRPFSQYNKYSGYDEQDMGYAPRPKYQNNYYGGGGGAPRPPYGGGGFKKRPPFQKKPPFRKGGFGGPRPWGGQQYGGGGGYGQQYNYPPRGPSEFVPRGPPGPYQGPPMDAQPPFYPGPGPEEGLFPTPGFEQQQEFGGAMGGEEGFDRTMQINDNMSKVLASRGKRPC